MAHPNEDLIRRGFDAFAKGDVDTLRELIDQDAVWHAPGRNPLSGDYRGVDAILGLFARLAELTGGTFRADVHDVVANDDHAVAIYATRGEREGRTLENRNVLVSHIRNGKFTESWLMSDDQYAADEFFSDLGAGRSALGEATASVGGLPSLQAGPSEAPLGHVWGMKHGTARTTAVPSGQSCSGLDQRRRLRAAAFARACRVWHAPGRRSALAGGASPLPGRARDRRSRSGRLRRSRPSAASACAPSSRRWTLVPSWNTETMTYGVRRTGSVPTVRELCVLPPGKRSSGRSSTGIESTQPAGTSSR